VAFNRFIVILKGKKLNDLNTKQLADDYYYDPKCEQGNARLNTKLSEKQIVEQAIKGTGKHVKLCEFFFSNLHSNEQMNEQTSNGSNDSIESILIGFN
jgi:hypothetical protein